MQRFLFGSRAFLLVKGLWRKRNKAAKNLQIYIPAVWYEKKRRKNYE